MTPIMWNIAVRVVMVIAVVVFFLLLKELVVFMFRSWLALCVFYTVNDIYRKRRFFMKHFKTAKNYWLTYKKIIF